jgi:hypothetical protein
MKRLSGSVTVVGLLSAGLGLWGCVSSPTYGTGVSSNQQLLDDVTSFGSFIPKQPPQINYKPRPALVANASDPTALPPPQKDVANRDNPAWPESPEQKRARLRAEATANQDNPRYEPQVSTDGGGGTAASPAFLEAQNKFARPNGSLNQQGADFKRRMAQNGGGTPTERKYLSEPPLAYRQPASTAPVGQLGENEDKKQREREAKAKKKGTGSVFGNLFSWL